jgi:Tol biopolymer transport system component
LSNGKTSLWLRPLGSLTAQQLPGTENLDNPHFFSPDSRSIVFPADGKLKKLDLAGGAQQTLCTMPRSNGQGTGGGSWNRDGVILFTSGGKIYRVASSGGEPELVLGSPLPEPDAYYRWPSFLPDGRHFLYLKTSVHQGTGSSAICVGSLDGQETARLRAADSHALYTAAAGGHLIYALDGALVAQAFDARAFKLSGEPFAIADKVVTANGIGRGFFSISDTGSLILHPSGNLNAQQLTWVDRTGKPLESFGESEAYRGSVGNPRLSPDGKQVAVARRDPQTRTREIYVMDITRGISSRLTFDSGEDYAPIWSPDGKRIAWSSNRNGPLAIYQKLSSGVGQDELLLKMDVHVSPDSWSPDGLFMLFDLTDPKTREDLWVLPMDGDRKPFPFLQTPFSEGQARFSPDGHFVVYRSDDQGRSEVYVQTFPASGSKWQISNNGGNFATWRNDGREIFYISTDGKLMSVEIKPGRSFEASVPKPLFDLAPLRAIGFGGNIGYAVSPDGQRFLVNRQVEVPASLQYVLVMNWATEVKK